MSKFRRLAVACALFATPAVHAIELTPIGRYETGVFAAGAAEISAFDAGSKRLFFVNADSRSVTILDLADPGTPALVRELDIQALFGDANFTASPNSVAIHSGLVAVAVERVNKKGEQKEGRIGFFDTSGQLLATAVAGALPDMVTFTPDGRRVLAANEGEPNADYSVDPQGSVTLVDVTALRASGTLAASATQQITFSKFNNQLASLRAAGVRIYGPGATVAQDLEPEYIAISPDGQTAYVSCQENNAVVTIDIARAKALQVLPLGYKDWSQSALDASDRDGAINIRAWPVFGMYEPDGLAAYQSAGSTYLVTANEGDARDYDTFAEEVRVRDLVLDPTAFPNASTLRNNANLGRLNVTVTRGDTDGDGDFDEIYALGGRSFSIWQVNSGLTRVFDSGDDFERITAAANPAGFNSDNQSNASFDTRSDNKGPEPEGLALGVIDGKTYAFIGLERIGGVIAYDISVPAAPVFQQYVNTRDFSGDTQAGTAGDLGPEGLEFVPAAASPTGKPLLIVANEISGSVVIFEIE
jgi:DNA-binding beta-propeller fold protein YncE